MKRDEENEPVVVYTTPSLAEAALIQSELDAAGFLCDTLNVQHTSMIWGGAAIGIRVIVPAVQARAAREFIENRKHVNFSPKDLGRIAEIPSQKTPRRFADWPCPICG